MLILLLSITPVLFLLWHAKMCAVNKTYFLLFGTCYMINNLFMKDTYWYQLVRVIIMYREARQRWKWKKE